MKVSSNSERNAGQTKEPKEDPEKLELKRKNEELTNTICELMAQKEELQRKYDNLKDIHRIVIKKYISKGNNKK